jgi:hypothetical protein
METGFDERYFHIKRRDARVGLRGTTGNRVYAQKVYRGFESLSLRHFLFPIADFGLPIAKSGYLSCIVILLPFTFYLLP